MSSGYVLGEKIKYKDVSLYEEYFKRIYRLLYPLVKEPTRFVQDKRPFLTLKDYAHLDHGYR